MQVDDYAEEDRREVKPPIELESATWARGGTLDWWVRERREWLVGYAVQMGAKDGSRRLIFVRSDRRGLLTRSRNRAALASGAAGFSYSHRPSRAASETTT